MSSTTFDTLAYSKTLQKAGIPQEHAEAMATAQKNALDEMVAVKELATKGDIQDVRLEIEKIRAEIKSSELRLLKWQIGGWIALATIMAKGFGWLGF